MTVSFELTGVEELETRLRTVQHDLRNKGGRAALRKAANLIARAARKNARAIDDPDTGRSIARNIAVRWDNRTFRRTGDLSFRIGVRGGGKFSERKGNPDRGAGGPTPHWHLVELGTRRSRAQPYIRPAGMEKSQEAAATFVQEYGKALDRLTR